MPKYRLLADSFINNTLSKAGEVVDYDGEPGANMEPVDKAAERITAVKKSMPKAVSDLVAKVRMHAATRGVSPSEASEEDVSEVLKVLPQPPTDATLAAVREAITPADATDLS